jgi:hypothetical protein
VLPFRVFGCAARRERARIAASSRNWLLVQSFGPAEVPQALVPRSHFAVGHFLGCVVFLRRTTPATLSGQCVLSASFAFLQSFAQYNLARQPQPVGTSHGLLVPTALEGSEIHFPRALPPPATVRLQGLVTLWAVYALRARAGFVSHRRRSWDSPFGALSSREGVHALSNRTGPPTVLPVVVPAAEALGRPDEPRFPGFHPSESPWRPNAGLVRWLLVAPLGFALLGSAGGSLVRGFARTPPTRFTDATLRPAPAGASESRSAFAWFRPIDPADRVKPEQPF